LLCAEHLEQQCGTQDVYAEAELSGHEEADCCPITSRVVISLPQRSSPDVQAQGGGQAMPSLSTQALNIIPRYNSRAFIWSSSSGPPLERLCVLRI
jgi:hypothetical protein